MFPGACVTKRSRAKHSNLAREPAIGRHDHHLGSGSATLLLNGKFPLPPPSANFGDEVGPPSVPALPIFMFSPRLCVSAVKNYCTGITTPVGDVFPPIDIVIAWFPAGIFVGTCTLIW
jgi:hypothetical protein